MFGLFDQPLGVPLHGGEERHRRVFERLDNAVGRGGDDPQALADFVHRLLVIRVDGDVALANRAAELAVGVELDRVAARLVAG